MGEERPKMAKLKVLIAGAGLGGLCLAQALRRQDVEVQVFERDKSPWDRPQGYRLHIDTDGVTALYQSLPPELYTLFDATAMKAHPFTTIVNTNLEVQKRFPCDEHGGTQEHASHGRPFHVNVNRVTLRQILMTGLGDVVRFGKSASRYETHSQGVTVTFEDGTQATGDLLVGADGMRSMVKKQRVPHAALQDTAVRAIYGRLPINEAVKVVPEQARGDVFTVAIDSKKLYLGIGPVIFPIRPELASAQLLPQAQLRPQEDYVVCIIGGRKELFGKDDAQLQAMSSEQLQRVSLELMNDWPESAKAIPSHGDPQAFFFIEMYTSIPCEMPKNPNVTLLGDAIHGMTPSLGRGANTAMRDAALLARHLESVVQGRRSLPEAMSQYEDEMTRHGFDVVRKSAAMGGRLMGQNPLPPGS
jgi:2-polyprenyl-6-methoxyphenol hydroxylase-like FAD-dependent oxidoreductase